MKKYLIKFFSYSFIFLFLVSCENKIAVTGISVGFTYALLYCKEKPVFYIIPYMFFSVVFCRELSYLLYLLLSLFPAVILLAVRYLFKKKYKLWVTLLLCTVSQISKFFLYHNYIFTIMGCVFAAVVFYISVMFLFSVLIRGFRYDMSEKEWSALLFFIGILGAGAYCFSLFKISFFYPIAAALISFGSCYNKEKTILACLCYGLGGSIVSLSFYPVGYCAVTAIAFYLISPVHRITGGVLSCALFTGAVYLFEKTFPLWTIIMTGAVFLTVFIPENVFSSWKVQDGYRGKFALRTIVNRDREEVGKKLSNVADAFETVKEILIEEKNDFSDIEEIATKVTDDFCRNCSRKKTCGYGMTEELKKVVVAALDSGKASLLDAGMPLGERCARLPKLISAADEAADKYTKIKERNNVIAQGKEMVISELSGISDLIRMLAGDIKTGFGFDTAKENRIKEELRYTDVIASDVAIYGNGREVTLTVRKKDVEKTKIGAVISSVMGEEMTEIRRKEIVGGMVSVEYGRAPAYGLLFGEASVSKENECGDSRQAVKLSQEKIMFILSDGMGTGKTAEMTADCSVRLIKAFYLAGFDHKTVFGCVSQLLSLRKREDFSALDVVVADTSNAEFDFIKQGGRESYLISKGNMEVIDGCSLPLGIIEETKPQIDHKRLKGGDIVVLISDGIADRLSYADMTELFGSIRSINPQVIADEIVRAAAQKPGKIDDMTAIVIRVIKNQ